MVKTGFEATNLTVTINLYPTKLSCLINGAEVSKFVEILIPVLERHVLNHADNLIQLNANSGQAIVQSLTQVVTLSTKGDSSLDLLFTDSPALVSPMGDITKYATKLQSTPFTDTQ